MEANRNDPRASVMDALTNWAAAGKGPLHQRLTEALKVAIRRGDIPSGTRLPAERELARRLAVSRSTVVAAYSSLRQEAWLQSRQGSGTWVPGFGGAPAAPAPEAEVLKNARRSVVFRELFDGPRNTIEFLGAHLPGSDVLSPALLSECAAELADQLHDPGYMPLGLPALRQAIAGYLGGWGLPTTPEQVLVTSGAQQAISLTASLYLQRGDTVVLENPTYVTAIDLFNALGAQLAPVSVGPDGVRLDQLREAVARRPRLLYLMPTFHNPTGTVLPERQRREIARLAEEQNIPVIEDNTLADLTLGVEPPPPISAFTAAGPVFTVGSLSKLFWGGLRIGWVRGPENVIRRLVRLRLLQDLGSSMLSQVVAVRLLQDLEAVKASRRTLVAENAAHLSALLKTHLPSWTFAPPSGGLSLWVRLPYGNATELAQVALRHGVSIVPGSLTSPDGAFSDHLRVPYVLSRAAMAEGVARLARAWKAYAPSVEAAGKRQAAIDVMM